MTVNYMHQTATANVFTFLRLLFKWRGSVWKSVWFELCVFLSAYYVITFLYHGLMAKTMFATIFEELVIFCRTLHGSSSTLLTFVLGFYVSQIYARWWSVFMMIPWPDALCFEMCAYIRTRGQGPAAVENDRKARNSIVRYMALSYVLCFREMSERIMKRFPTFGHLINAQLLTKEEQDRLEKTNDQRALWMPLEWAALLLRQCYRDRLIDEIHYAKIVTTLADYRERLHNVLQYDWVNVPLVYTQVVQICCMSYFFLRLITAQSIKGTRQDPHTWIQDLAFPAFAIFEFIFFVGWLKVGQVMINPFGMDDDDFDIDTIIERNLIVSYSAVDTMFEKVPDLVDIKMKHLPHTKASLVTRNVQAMNPMKGSATVLEVPKEEQKIVHVIPSSLAPLRMMIGADTQREAIMAEVSAMQCSKELGVNPKSHENAPQIPVPPPHPPPPPPAPPASARKDTQRQEKTNKTNKKRPSSLTKKKPSAEMSVTQKIAPNTPIGSRREVASSKKIVENARERLELIAKVNRKRQRLERISAAKKEEIDEDDTQKESNDDEEEEGPRATPEMSYVEQPTQATPSTEPTPKSVNPATLKRTSKVGEEATQASKASSTHKKPNLQMSKQSALGKSRRRKSAEPSIVSRATSAANSRRKGTKEMSAPGSTQDEFIRKLQALRAQQSGLQKK